MEASVFFYSIAIDDLKIEALQNLAPLKFANKTRTLIFWIAEIITHSRTVGDTSPFRAVI